MPFRLQVLVIKEEDGQFSSFAMNLPGVCGCGDTETEAIESVKQGFLLSLESYREDGENIPWTTPNPERYREGTTRDLIVEDPEFQK